MVKLETQLAPTTDEKSFPVMEWKKEQESEVLESRWPVQLEARNGVK